MNETPLIKYSVDSDNASTKAYPTDYSYEYEKVARFFLVKSKFQGNVQSVHSRFQF